MDNELVRDWSQMRLDSELVRDWSRTRLGSELFRDWRRTHLDLDSSVIGANCFWALNMFEEREIVSTLFTRDQHKRSGQEC